MEFGDDKPKGLKARLFRAIDPQAKADAAERKRADIQDTIAVRRANIEAERQRRADIREGKRKDGVRSYVGSVIREKRESSRVRDLEEKLYPDRKVQRKQDREIRNLQTRQKWRKRVQRVDNVFDSINEGLDKVQSFTGGSKKGGSSNMFGISDAQMREMAGMSGGSAPKRKSSSKRGMVPIYSGSRIVGYSQGVRRRKAAKKPRSIFDIDVGF